MNKEPGHYDPKVVPSPCESTEITIEFTRKELELIDDAVRDGGFWSRQEFFRSVSADAVKKLAAATLNKVISRS
jgi:hypothetical protein